MAKKYETIYIDWDGVLWDFKRAFCDWVEVIAPHTDKWEFYEALGMTADKFHEVLSELPQEFWQQEKYILPHAQDLVAWARANAENVFILTVAPEWECSRAKQNLANNIFGLGLYAVDKAEDKVEFAAKGCLLIDDKPSTVTRFAREVNDCSLFLVSLRYLLLKHSAFEAGIGGGYVWPTNYNQSLDHSWYFKRSWLHGHKAHHALTDSDRADILKDMKADTSTGTIKGRNLYDYDRYDYSGKIEEKPKLDYEAMDEAKKRKMTPMYSGLLAYFPDALALVARNSMVGHWQHNDPSEPMYWDRSKSADEMDAMIRHMADHSKNPRDADGTLHMSKVAWRALAFLQKFIEEEQQNDDN